jgi:predicted Ser/Thr protein kinase
MSKEVMSKKESRKKKMSKGWISVAFDCESKYFILFYSRKKKRCIGNENKFLKKVLNR